MGHSSGGLPTYPQRWRSFYFYCSWRSTKRASGARVLLHWFHISGADDEGMYADILKCISAAARRRGKLVKEIECCRNTTNFRCQKNRKRPGERAAMVRWLLGGCNPPLVPPTVPTQVPEPIRTDAETIFSTVSACEQPSHNSPGAFQETPTIQQPMNPAIYDRSIQK